MPDPRSNANHLEVLLKDMVDLEQEMRQVHHEQINARDVRRAHREYYTYATDKLNQINNTKRALQEELYDAIMSSNHKRLGKTEVRLRKLTDDQAEVQRGLPDRLKNYAIAIKCENELIEARAAIRRRMELKQEEVHRLRPCEVFLCDHCRNMTEKRERVEQYGVTLVERVKGKFKRGWKN